MTRETRYNLIFLVLICGLSAPGAVILFRKKLDPKAPAMYLPKPVRQTLAAIDPRPAPETVQRVVGPFLTEWLNSINWANEFGTEINETSLRPLSVSQHRTFQAGLIDRTDSEILAGLVGWAAAAAEERVAGQLAFRVVLPDGSEFQGDRVASRRVPLPVRVRSELQDQGYILPPSDVHLLCVRFTHQALGNKRQSGPLSLRWDCPGCRPFEADTLDLALASAAPDE